MRWKPSLSILTVAAAGGFAAGLFGSVAASADQLLWTLPTMREMHPVPTLEPMRALPRTAGILAMMEARSHLEAQRPWTAWTMLREHVEDPERAAAPTILLAARAAAGWGAWDRARDLLAGRSWLDRVDAGEGWLLLAEAEEELGNPQKAADAYRRYAELASGRERGVALARLGRILRAENNASGAAAAFAAAAPLLPDVEDWLRLLEVEQRLAARDTDALSQTTQLSGGSASVRRRRVHAEAMAWAAAGDTARALRRLEWETRVLGAQGARAEAAQLTTARAVLLRGQGRTTEARDLLRAVAWEPTVLAAARVAAAAALGEMPGRDGADELARAAAYEAGNKPGLAARSLRAALDAGAADDAGARLRLARLLYAARDYGPARSAFRAAAERLPDAEMAAEAELLAARAAYRSGHKQAAVKEFHRIAEERAGTAAAGTALFLLGDEASSVKSALSYYRRASEVTRSPDAREALYRVGDRSLKLDDTAGAIRAWERYVTEYPRGEETARVAYQTGRLHERAGRESAARAMYTAAITADPLAYHALQAANRLGVDPLEQALREPHPWIGLAADPVDAANALARLDALDELGLEAERAEELAHALRAFEDRPLALLTMAEGLRDRGHPVQAIRLGHRLHERRGQWDDRLLRVVFPLLYRDLLEREADRHDVDPMLLAGLIRQESTFRPAVKSWVGATGLGQIMPATGRWLAPSAGVRGYEEKLLEVPEVNLRMSALYLGDLVERYDGARDLALAAYNAGPGRADRWRRELDYHKDVDAFRDRIPFDETRHYVKVVLRNAAVYRRLYGEPRSPGLVTAE